MWNTPAHIRENPNDVKGVPVMSSVGETLLNANRELIQL